MILPTYRRTAASYVTLYRVQPDGSWLELGAYFSTQAHPSAHALADARQQEDVLQIAEQTDHEQHNSSNQTQP